MTNEETEATTKEGLLARRASFKSTAMAWTASVASVVTLVAPAIVREPADYWCYWRLSVGFTWTVGPPLWLFYEWFYLQKDLVKSKEIEIATVVHEQGVVRALWAAHLVAVAALYKFPPFNEVTP